MERDLRAGLRRLTRRVDLTLLRTPVTLQGRPGGPGRRGLARRHEWSIGVAAGPTLGRLTSLVPGGGPALTRRDVTDVTAEFVADPFLWPHRDGWAMFFEVLNARRDAGEIGLATSRDLRSWRYEGIVLREPWHLSYPFVFAHDGDHWMVPESEATGRVTLYRATSFPHRWEAYTTLLEGAPYGDATLWQAHGTWHLLAASGGSATLRCFTAPALLGPWSEHPSSPVVDGGSRVARPGGRVVELDDGRWVRFAQDAREVYGGGLEMFAFGLPLAADGVRGVPLGRVAAPAEPAGRTAWTELGLHTLDAHRTADGWVASLDGRGYPRG